MEADIPDIVSRGALNSTNSTQLNAIVLIGWAAINIIINVTWARCHVTATTNHRLGLTERGQVAC